MPCEWYEINGTVMHINRGRSPRRKQICKFCGDKYGEGKLCDFPIEHGKTCDAAMCNNCSRTLGAQHTDIGQGMKRLNDTIDVCPIHRESAIVRAGKLEAV